MRGLPFSNWQRETMRCLTGRVMNNGPSSQIGRGMRPILNRCRLADFQRDVMMRKVLIALGMACLLHSAGELQAQDSYEADRNPQQNVERTTTVSPQFLIYQRAAKRAEARAERTAARKWYGISPQRPRWHNASFADGLGEFSYWHFGYTSWPRR
jgi:hypothetical protein